MTVTPDDPNFGNKGIENMGSDLLARLSVPNKATQADYVNEADAFGQFESDETYYGQPGAFEYVDGNEGSEPEESEEEYDPDDPGISEQRRLLALQFAAALNPVTTDGLINSAKAVEKWLRGQPADPTPDAPEAAHGPQASPAPAPGEGLTDAPEV